MTSDEAIITYSWSSWLPTRSQCRWAGTQKRSAGSQFPIVGWHIVFDGGDGNT
jgi:hypothetical protein